MIFKSTARLVFIPNGDLCSCYFFKHLEFFGAQRPTLDDGSALCFSAQYSAHFTVDQWNFKTPSALSASGCFASRNGFTAETWLLPKAFDAVKLGESAVKTSGTAQGVPGASAIFSLQWPAGKFNAPNSNGAMASKEIPTWQLSLMLTANQGVTW
jgi:hypothetical protein